MSSGKQSSRFRDLCSTPRHPCRNHCNRVSNMACIISDMTSTRSSKLNQYFLHPFSFLWLCRQNFGYTRCRFVECVHVACYAVVTHPASYTGSHHLVVLDSEFKHQMSPPPPYRSSVALIHTQSHRHRFTHHSELTTWKLLACS